MGKEISCPKCGSHDLEAVSSTKKPLSLSKGIIGGVFFGPVGAAGGAILGNKGKVIFLCHKCGYTWETKI